MMSNRITYFPVPPFSPTEDVDFLAEATLESADQTRNVISRRSPPITGPSPSRRADIVS
jgi:hypothetical protein